MSASLTKWCQLCYFSIMKFKRHKSLRTNKEAWDLVLKWQRWIYGYTRQEFIKFSSIFGGLLGFTFDDCLQDAMLIAHRAAELYDEQKGAFPTYARCYIKEYAFLCHIRNKPTIGGKRRNTKQDTFIKFISLHSRIFNMSLNRNRSEFFVDNPLSDNWLAADEITDSAHDRTDINLNKLASIKNGEILYEMFWNEKNGQQIAKKIGISREAVRQRKKIAMNQLRKRLGTHCLTGTPLL